MVPPDSQETCAAQRERYSIWCLQTWADVKRVMKRPLTKEIFPQIQFFAEQVHEGRCLLWEQWSGLVQRGKPRRPTNSLLASAWRSKVERGTLTSDGNSWRSLWQRAPTPEPAPSLWKRKIRSAQYEYWHHGDDMWALYRRAIVSP